MLLKTIIVDETAYVGAEARVFDYAKEKRK